MSRVNVFVWLCTDFVSRSQHNSLPNRHTKGQRFLKEVTRRQTDITAISITLLKQYHGVVTLPPQHTHTHTHTLSCRPQRKFCVCVCVQVPPTVYRRSAGEVLPELELQKHHPFQHGRVLSRTVGRREPQTVRVFGPAETAVPLGRHKRRRRPKGW